MQKEIIDIIIPSSDKYMPYTTTLMVSALENINPHYRLNFHILTEDVNNGTKQRVEMIRKNYDFDIEYIYLSEENCFKLPYCVNTHIDSKIVYSKLMISSLFPKMKRAIILEGDMIVVGDLSELWQINIDNYCIAAVKDAWYRCHNEGFKTLPYFNTGMFYANLDKWREINFESKVTKTISKIKLKFPDQDLFNVIFENSVLYLDWCWNVTACIQVPKYRFDTILTREEINDIMSNPRIIHYVDKNKPWLSFTEAYVEYFWHYAKKTPFYEIMILPLLNCNGVTSKDYKQEIQAVLKYRKNVLNYWRCRIMYNLASKKKRKHYSLKKKALKEQIRLAERFLK